MFKPLTLSLSLAVALGACSVSMAGLFASPQCAPSAEAPCASSQSCLPSPQSGCLPKKHWNFHLPKPCFTYEWVLKKKMVWSCNKGGCETCVMPSSQCAPSAQSYGSPQGYPSAYGSGQAYPTSYGSGQIYGGTYGAGQMTSAPATMTPAAPTGDEAPPAPAAPASEAPAPPAAPEAPAAPAPPAPSASGGPQSSLLFSTPSGN